MSNYVKLTDFASKDALTSGDPLKLIKGTEINSELNAIQTAIATKADLASPAFSGNPTATTQTFGNNSSRIATTAFVQAALQALHPVGSIYIAVISTNPAVLFGFGTWVAFGTGRTIVGLDSGNTAFDVAEETGGSADAIIPLHNHNLNFNDPGHDHQVGWVRRPSRGSPDSPDDIVPNPVYTTGTAAMSTTDSTGITVSIDAAGTSPTNANLPPYVVVYMWKRTA